MNAAAADAAGAAAAAAAAAQYESVTSHMHASRHI